MTGRGKVQTEPPRINSPDSRARSFPNAGIGEFSRARHQISRARIPAHIAKPRTGARIITSGGCPDRGRLGRRWGSTASGATGSGTHEREPAGCGRGCACGISSSAPSRQVLPASMALFQDCVTSGHLVTGISLPGILWTYRSVETSAVQAVGRETKAHESSHLVDAGHSRSATIPAQIASPSIGASTITTAGRSGGRNRGGSGAPPGKAPAGTRSIGISDGLSARSRRQPGAGSEGGVDVAPS